MFPTLLIIGLLEKRLFLSEKEENAKEKKTMTKIEIINKFIIICGVIIFFALFFYFIYFY